MTLSADERAHARNDHSACGADTDCHEIWLAELARAGENAAIQDHTNERHRFCYPEWRCRQIWDEDQRNERTRLESKIEARREEADHQSAPLTAEGGGQIPVEAIVQHHMRGHIEQDVSHFGAVHPNVLETRKGDILLLPSRTGTDLIHPSNEHSALIDELGVEAVYTSRLLTQPFILRKADDE